MKGVPNDSLDPEQQRQVRRLRFDPATERAYADQHTAGTIGRVRIVFTLLALFGVLGLVAGTGATSNDPAASRLDLAFTAVFFVLFGMAFVPRLRRFAAPLLATSAVLTQIGMGLTAKNPEPTPAIVINLLYAIIIVATLQTRFWTSLVFCVALLGAIAWTFSYRGTWSASSGFGYAMMVAQLVFLCLASYLGEVRDRKSFLLERSLASERERTKALVRNVLPPTIADHLSQEPGQIARHHESATVLFADLIGFTPFAETHAPDKVVGMLSDVFSRFDRLVAASAAVKIKTVGDCYMVAGGIPDPDPDHIATVANLALELRGAANAAGIPIRIGIHTGPLIAGVLGTERLMYDIWGPTVNFASRLESAAEAGQILVSAAVGLALEATHDLDPLGELDLKGLGPKEVFLLRKRKVASLPIAGSEAEVLNKT